MFVTYSSNTLKSLITNNSFRLESPQMPFYQQLMTSSLPFKTVMKFKLYFLTCKKLFDSVPHRSLLQKIQLLEISNHLINWITNYLHHRVQQVADKCFPDCACFGLSFYTFLPPVLSIYIIIISDNAHPITVLFHHVA